ncbi:NADPH-dependent FMN reductase [Desertihabitans aurantiacus]|uniref:NADPH-dependent FMN reductase n=1 Tax=Desertihabitans aurantiacus TaxID=2282477 RepID=UPI000DF83746|nr:NAD(P)H-dependent oxidoreductase [Desertihabitans aurantiacus]
MTSPALPLDLLLEGTTVPTTVLSGNPRPGSRTLALARLAATQLDPDTDLAEIDLAGLGGDVLDPAAPAVADALRTLTGSELAVLATPSYKGSFTGLLKVFLDHLPAGGLAGVTVLPVVVAASGAHLVQTQQHLDDVLRELGADVLPGLSVGERQLAAPGEAVAAWHASFVSAELRR